jgi:prepilin-type N-terminal cleavage/methylation domain-containing protein
MQINVTQSSHPSKSSSNNFRGFTLIEILITVALALMVIGLTFTSFYYSARASRQARINTNVDFELMKLYAQMRQQMLNMYVPRDQSAPLKGRKTKDEHCDELYFFTSSPVVGKGVVEASYAIKKTEEGTPFLAYRELLCRNRIEMDEGNDIAIPSDLPEEQWRKLSNGIQGLSVTYMEKEKVSDEWSENKLPQQVVVSLWYTADKEERNFSFCVTPGLYVDTSKTQSPTPAPSSSASAPTPAVAPTGSTSTP